VPCFICYRFDRRAMAGGALALPRHGCWRVSLAAPWMVARQTHAGRWPDFLLSASAAARF